MSQLSSTHSPPAAIEAARRRHGSALLRYATDLFDSDKRQAESALARAWEELERDEDGETPDRERLFAAVRHHVLEAQRSAGALQRFEGGTDAWEDASPRGAVSLRAAVENAFARLTPKQQEALRLKFAHGFRHDQIARITGLSATHAAQVMHTALSRVAHAARPAGEKEATATDDARLTLAALDELGPEGRAALASGGRDPDVLRREIEQRRQIAHEVSAAIARGRRRSRRSARNVRPMRIAIVVVIGVAIVGVAGAIWWRSSEKIASPPAPELTRVPAAGTVRVAVQAREDSVAARKNAPAGETENLGVFRAVALPASSNATNGESVPIASLPAAAIAPPAPAASREAAPVEPAAEARGRAAPASTRAPQARMSAPATVETLPTGATAARNETSAPVAPPAPVDSTDVAPITALRRALGEARWPRTGDVELAALRRHFSRAVGAAPAAETVMARAESAALPWRAGAVAVRLTATAKRADAASRAPANIVLLLDVSGSMAAPNRLPLVQEALGELLDLLQPQDRVGIVTYAGEPQVIRPLAPVSDFATLRSTLGSLEARGQTNGGAGLEQALAVVAADRDEYREHVVVLCTDGEFNFGQTSEEELAQLIAGPVESGVRLAIFGFGRNGAIDPRLEALAARARGGSGYVNTRAEAVAVLARQLDPLFAPVARAVQLEADDGVIRVGAAAEALMPGETLDVITSPTAGTRAALRYFPMAGEEARELAFAADSTPVEFAAASDGFKFALLAHAVGEVLRDGPLAAGRLAELARWAEATLPDDAGGYRRELLALIDQARAAAQR